MKAKNQLRTSRRLLSSLAFATTFAIIASPGIALADTEMEYEASEGYHEEEWYDPSDWFNEDNQISYETDDGWNDNDWYDSYYDTYWYDADYDYPYTATYPVGYSAYYYWDADNSAWTESDQNESRTASNQSDKKSQANRNGRIDGQIDGFKKVSLRDRKGVKQDHSFVKVNLKNGKSRVISLGESVEMKDLDLEKGDKISATGKVMKLDGKTIILADTIRTGGETFNIADKKQPNLQKGQKNSSDKSMVTRRGTLEDSKRVKLDNSKRSDHLIVRLEMEDGRSCVADMGPNVELSDLGLDQGDSVLIKGCTTTVNDRKLIVAREVRIDGDSKKLRNSDDRSSASNR